MSNFKSVNGSKVVANVEVCDNLAKQAIHYLTLNLHIKGHNNEKIPICCTFTF